MIISKKLCYWFNVLSYPGEKTLDFTSEQIWYIVDWISKHNELDTIDDWAEYQIIDDGIVYDQDFGNEDEDDPDEVDTFVEMTVKMSVPTYILQMIFYTDDIRKDDLITINSSDLGFGDLVTRSRRTGVGVTGIDTKTMREDSYGVFEAIHYKIKDNITQGGVVQYAYEIKST
jgi:hypothetical protein